MIEYSDYTSKVGSYKEVVLTPLRKERKKTKRSGVERERTKEESKTTLCRRLSKGSFPHPI